MSIARAACLLLVTCLALPLPVRSASAEDEAPQLDPKAHAAALIKAFKSDDVETRLDAALAAKDVQHASLTTPLAKLLSDKQETVREAAIAALANRTDKSARKKAASSLAARLPRLTKDSVDEAELYQVIEALGALRQTSAIKPLMGPINLETKLDEVQARVMAVAEIPDAKAIEALIDFLAKGRRGGAGVQRNAAKKALQYATGANPVREGHAKAGKDADRWRAWWRDNKKDFDFDAIIQAREDAAAAAQAKADRKKAQQEKRKRDKEDRRRKKAQGGGKPKPKPNSESVPD